ncbi:hypothetical protein [Alistipes sp. ZOR0009]|uniref:hypothetical protein n=1 Tax=Alistipes sp. ZOR0009 TaxID=1339253 RepID=UPI0006483E2F|nr:hypothetical protein [Alistipes sp. ZOR0009]
MGLNGILSEVTCAFQWHRPIKLKADVNITNEGKKIIVDFSFNLLRSHADFRKRRETVREVRRLLPFLTSLELNCCDFLISILQHAKNEEQVVVIKIGLEEKQVKFRKSTTGNLLELEQTMAL